MIDPPGLTRRPSLLLLTPRGGRLLAEHRGNSPWSYIRRANDARDHCWHVSHDLEANGFFVDLAVTSRLSTDQGLLLWIGEESSRNWPDVSRKPKLGEGPRRTQLDLPIRPARPPPRVQIPHSPSLF